MNHLLEQVVDAHGGLRLWNRFSTVQVTLTTGGALWSRKKIDQDPDPRRMTVRLHEQRASVAPFGDPDWYTDFTPDRIAILRGDGSVVAERRNPRASFTGHGMHTPWDKLDRAYFNGYAMWTYLTTPFLLTMPGVEVNETCPLSGQGETWRVLRARFPSSIATHSTEQDFYFDDSFLLKRHDYNVDVAGGFEAAQLVFDYIDADGIRLPGKRRAYTRAADGTANLNDLLVSIDLTNASFS